MKRSREGQRGMENKLRILERILEGEKSSHGRRIPSLPCGQLASTRSCGERSSKPRITSVAFPGAA